MRSLAAATVDASQVAGLQEVNLDRGTAALTVSNLAKDASAGLIGNGVATLGALTASYVAAATSANISVTGGTGAMAAGTLTISDGAGLTSATITGSNGVNTINGVAFGTGAGTADNVKAVTIDAQSNLTTGNITGLAASTAITVKGAGTANIGTLQATNVVSVDASANTGGVTAVLNNVTGIKFVGGSGNDVVTTGAVLAGTASVDAGAGTADRLVVADSTHVTATVGKFYKGFEQLQVQDGVSVDVEHLAAGNTIDTILINQSSTTATGVTNLSAAQAANVAILAAGGTNAITIGVKDATVTGQIDTVKAALTTTTAAGAANTIDLTNLTLTGVEKLVLDGNGTVAAATGGVTLTTTNAISLDSITLSNAGVNSITIAGGQTATNLIVDASGSSGATTINASAYAVGTGAQLLGGSGNDTLTGSANNDIIKGGAGNDTITGGAGIDSLSGGAGANIFVFAAGSSAANSVTGYDTITDWAAGTGNKIDFGGTNLAAVTHATAPVTGTASINANGLATFAGTDTTLAAQLTAVGADAAGTSVVWANGGNSYLFITDGNAGIGANDVLIQLTGVNAAAGLTFAGGDITAIA
ncbi:S-layer protein RsaA [Castellaniella defragrans 65Phen]|uniref:S-layer protein RsaA n=1 Tax=Castellaniella defragrans (strain DSM 12143 / CCUG 39792 / 65Phen) TaxID=1437824 RepID=W8X0N9_CASD6|nr:S-layer protein RsaA [Castellaniella defragrans 65Phen]